MLTFTREEIKAAPELSLLLQFILQKHQTPDHTVKHLLSLIHVDNICEITKIFAMFEAGDKTVYLSYECEIWIKRDPTNPGELTFPTKITSITLYEDYVEYENIRVKELSAAAPEDRDARTLKLN